jgi:hypothetical protein
MISDGKWRKVMRAHCRHKQAQCKRWLSLSIVVTIFALFMDSSTRPASAQDLEVRINADYDPVNTGWNGLSRFRQLIDGLGLTAVEVSTLEWGELGADEILLLLYPQQTVDPAQLDAFIQAGGNVIIADDFGGASNALARLGLVRSTSETLRAASYYEGRSWAPIAAVTKGHPVADQVLEVVCNHPAALEQLDGATTIAGFKDGAVIAAGERGTGKFVAISDPSIMINRMQEFPGNVRVMANALQWLDRHGKVSRVVIVRGDVPMHGEARAYIDDEHASPSARSVAGINRWLDERSTWLLVSSAMKGLALGAGAVIIVLLVFAVPWRRGPRVDGAWLSLHRPSKKDSPQAMMRLAMKGQEPHLISACLLRDQISHLLAGALGKRDPLNTLTPSQLTDLLRARHGIAAVTAFELVSVRLRRLPSRSQAAAPWGGGYFSRREFDSLYQDCSTVCRTLGVEL